MMKEIESVELIKYGGYENIVTKMVPNPLLKNSQIRIKVKACGVNFCDALIWQGIHKLKNQSLPKTMGIECAGIIEELDQDIKEFQIGDRVLCWSFTDGLWAESVCVPAINCLKIPSAMTYEEAAAFPINYLTAFLSIMELGHLRPGQVVLLQMAAGGVGGAITQLSKTIENVTIIGIASSNKHQTILNNGVTYCLDYECDIVSEVRKLYPAGVDIIIASFCGSELSSIRQLLKPMGRIIVIGAANLIEGERTNIFHLIKIWWQTKYINLIELINKNQSVCGLNIEKLFESDPEYFRMILKELLDLYEQKKLKPIIHCVYPFSEVKAAFQCIIQRKNIGKLILVPSKEFHS